jgi:hypothetical protein
MIWSKLKHQIESGFADNVKNHIQLYLTTYKNSTGYIGRGWITYDGEEIANFSNMEAMNKTNSFSNVQCKQYPENMSHEPTINSDRHIDNLVEKGEFTKYDFSGSCWDFLNMNILDAQSSKNPIFGHFPY